MQASSIILTVDKRCSHNGQQRKRIALLLRLPAAVIVRDILPPSRIDDSFFRETRRQEMEKMGNL